MAGTEIAKITFDREKREISSITFTRKDLRFKCKRCAVFCCKLGGPIVKETDLKRIAKIGLDPYKFIAPLRRRYGQQGDAIGVLKQKEDGSCIFLEYDESRGIYKCGIYEARPALCRLYPFEFTLEENGTGVLSFIPCCNGLNALDGILVDREFVEKYLLDVIVEAI